jgi:hypothetical protein
MYKCIYIQYIKGLVQSRLSTADNALLFVAPAIVALRVRCRGNLFISRSLATIVSSGSNIPVFQLTCHNIEEREKLLMNKLKKLNSSTLVFTHLEQPN